MAVMAPVSVTSTRKMRKTVLDISVLAVGTERDWRTALLEDSLLQQVCVLVKEGWPKERVLL